MTKADKDWGLVFDKFDLAKRISEEGFVDVRSQDIKSLGLEPRLLTKVDHSHQVPQPLKANGLTILTLSSSMWRLGPFDIFRSLPTWKPLDKFTTTKELPQWINSIDPANITGEGALMNAAFSSGILDDFCQEALIPTVSGKGRSGKFSFSVDLFDRTQAVVDVDGAQIEIDAGYEGSSSLYLFEAKKHISVDFNMRQLYYPLRTWQQKVSKPIKTIFITLANDVFDLTEYAFLDPSNFSSAEMVQHKRYTLSASRITRQELLFIAQRSATTSSPASIPSAPFPQADDFERVMDMASFLGEKPRTADDIATNYEFHIRQSDYYFSALKFLGLADVQPTDDGQKLRVPTETGTRIQGMPPRERKLAYAELLLAIGAIRKTFLMAATSGHIPSSQEVEDFLREDSIVFGIAGSTVHRRAQTVQAWTRWLLNLDEESLF